MTQRSTRPTTKFLMALGICSSLLLAQFAAGAATLPYLNVKASFNEEDKPAKKTKTTKPATKALAKLNNEAVKIYPDALKREMHVVAKDNDGKQVDFFVFDLEGTLVQNYKMQPKDHNKISGLKRGTYVYRVFSGDEETAAGQFEIR